MNDLDIILGLYFYSIGKCDKHLKFYTAETSNQIMKQSGIDQKQIRINV